jgi:cytochrome c556
MGRLAQNIRALSGRKMLHPYGPGLAEPAAMANSRRIGIWALVVAGSLAVSTSCASPEANRPPQMAQLTQAITPPDRQGPPEPLSASARALLKDRMASHAQNMSQLVSAIMLLQYSEIITRADKIAGDVNLSRPTSNDATELNASIPEKFFVRQDDLKAAAHNLAIAGRTGNPYLVAEAYGKLSENCVRCHADYRPRD